MIDIGKIAENSELFDGRYKLIKALSTDGGTADVWLAIDVNTIDNPELLGEDIEDFSAEESGMLVAIKIYRPKNALDIEGEQRFRDEYKIVHNCRHTNLLQPTNFSIYQETPYLELPYCKNGSSEMLIGQEFKEKEIWKFIYDVSSGLSYLHACNPPIIHQDVKPANVLIDDNRNYAITDFGISSQRGGKHDYYYDEDNSGTMAYMAPERFKEDYKPIAESDIWAFGATLYEILTGEVPYKEEGGKNQLENNMKIKPMGKQIPKDVQKLILSCLSINPKNRPTANDIINISEKHITPSNKFAKIILIAMIVGGFSVGGYFAFLPKQVENVQPIQIEIPIEERFDRALLLLDSDSKEDVELGILMMDSLVNINCVPAMYELARTYGWFSDSISLKRKDILGIKYNTKGDIKYLPISDKYSDRARNLYAKILDMNDSTIAIVKANAAYRLASYSVNENDSYGRNLKKAQRLLMSAKDYAIESNENLSIAKLNKGLLQKDSLIKNIDNALLRLSKEK